MYSWERDDWERRVVNGTWSPCEEKDGGPHFNLNESLNIKWEEGRMNGKRRPHAPLKAKTDI